MPIEVVDETNGPGRPITGDTQHVVDRMLSEIWQALGYPPGRVPVLDEVLQEIRNLRDAEPPQHVRHADITPLMPDEDEDEPHEVIENGGLILPAVQSVTYGAFGMTIVGYSAAEVMQIREHGLRTAKEAKS